MRPLRGAVMGGGHMGRLHAGKLLARPGVELLAVVDPRPSVPEGLPWAREVPAGLDFAVIAAPARLHAEIALPLLDKGVACLVEKPLAATSEEAAALASRSRLSVDHLERFNPALRALPPGFRASFLKAERLAPFGPRGTDVDVVLDLMIHDLDLVLQLCGGRVTLVRSAGMPVRSSGVDIVEAWVETSSGAVASLAASRVSRKASRRLRLVGDGAWWSMDLAAGEAHRERRGAAREALAVPGGDALDSVHSAFLAAVRGDAPFPVPGPEGLRAVELAERVAKLARR